MKRTQLFACAVLLVFVVSVQADTTINTINKWAYSPSTSWINCRPTVTNGAVIGEFICSGFFYCATTGWIHLSNDDGPTNGFQYTNLGDDWGVNHIDGKLRGLAWAESTGWVNFEDSGNPTVDLETGRITGCAWGEGVGWIKFDGSQAFLETDGMPSGDDNDSDSIPDMWELEQTGSTNLLASGTNDYDKDGITDYDEYIAGSNPADSNSYLKVTDITLTGGTNISLTWSSALARLYKIEENDDLMDTDGWLECGLGTLSPDSDSNTTIVLDLGSYTQLFYRIKAFIPFSE